MGNNPPFIITGDKEEFERKQDDGIYDITATASRRYIDPDAYGGEIYSWLSEIEWQPESYRLLDIGSSSAEPLEALKDRLENETEAKFEAYALDVNREMAERCKEYDNAEPVQARAQRLPFRDDSIDVIVSNQLHLLPDDIEKTVDEIDRVLKNDGVAALREGYDLPNTDYTGLHEGSISSI